jgi:asparagine synthase (glutamine-hydrolysing)
MCGICGWFGTPPAAPATLAAAQWKLLRHRGPDDAGFEVGAGWGLGFRRLSILDLSACGHQPMHSRDGRFWLVFNGEIYNFIELRTMLEAKGESFIGGSDTEVLLRLLALRGAGALGLLNGMFAFAFIDTQARTFLLARDRLGKKPLYYQVRKGQLRFASELKALLAWPDATRSLDLSAVAEYLALGYLPGESCIFKGYEKLAPGHFLAGSLDAPEAATPTQYWRLPLAEAEGLVRFDDKALDELADLLTDAVRVRLRSDVPVGVFLSGGLDSGLVTALIPATGAGVRPLALTVAFDEEEYDESSLAQAVTQQTGLAHRVVHQRRQSLTQVDQIGWFYDEPFGDASALPTLALCAEAANHATVFLAGDGGDEAFGGYRRYSEALRYGWLAGLPAAAGLALNQISRLISPVSTWRYRLAKLALPDAGFAAAFDGTPNDPLWSQLCTPELQPYLAGAGQAIWRRWSASRGLSLTARQQVLDYSLYLPDDILVKVDRASMAHSIEVRSPLLDHRVVEWAARLDRRDLVNARWGKLPLRALGKRVLPARVQAGEKRGFGVPLDAWFRQDEGVAFLRERLLSAEAKRRALWDVGQVAQVIEWQRGSQMRPTGEYLWRLLVFDAWARQYCDGKAFLQGPPKQSRENSRFIEYETNRSEGSDTGAGRAADRGRIRPVVTGQR